MKRAIWITLVAALAFAAVLVARLPASWAISVLPQGISCTQMRGTVWNGVCESLTVENAPLGNLTWHIRPTALLRGAVVSQVALDGPPGTAVAEVTARSQDRITARDLRASLRLNPASLPSLSSNVRGDVQTDLPYLHLEKNVIAGIEGRIDVRNLQGLGAQGSSWGDFVVIFPPDRSVEPVGDVRSTGGGPLELEGKLRLTREPGFVLEGRMKPGPGAPPDLVQKLGALGTPDAGGWRPFSVAGTF
jgi:hypothetical protein